MATQRKAADILREIAAIAQLERGKLCPMRSPSGRIHYNLQYWSGGRNRCEYVAARDLESVRKAVANYHRYRQLVEAYAGALERETRRQRGEEGAEKKKLREELAQAACREIDTVLGRHLGPGATLAGAETDLRAALGRIGVQILRAVMQSEADRADAERPRPRGMIRQGRRPIWVRCLWGDFRIRRAYYTAKSGGRGSAPAEQRLGIWQSYTPAMARVLSKLAAQLPFAGAAAILQETTGARVNARQFHRLTAQAGSAARRWLDAQKPAGEQAGILYVSFDGVAVPMRKRHLRGRRGRGPGGTPKTREIRLGCAFTQTSCDRRGKPVRDPDSTTYLAALCSSRDFGHKMRAEARRRGLAAGRRVVVISDGAKWCEKLAALRFPGRVHILDFYHAAEHVRELSSALLGEGKPSILRFKAWRRTLYRGKAPELIAEAESLLGQAVDRGAAEREIRYLRHNLERMRYAHFRRQGLFIGSGVVEAGCKTVVAQRTKLSGMLWGRKGLEDLLTLRCLLLSRRIDSFWGDALTPRRAG